MKSYPSQSYVQGCIAVVIPAKDEEKHIRRVLGTIPEFVIVLLLLMMALKTSQNLSRMLTHTTRR